MGGGIHEVDFRWRHGILVFMKTMQSNVKVPRNEYVRLKKLDKQFGAFLS